MSNRLQRYKRERERNERMGSFERKKIKENVGKDA